MTSRRARGAACALAVSLAGVALAASPGEAIATRTMALWEMNEPAGATTMVDSSGNNINGTIGSDVVTGVTYQGATGHRFATHLPREMREFPGHVNRVAHNTRLNPDSGDFTVEIRFRTNYSFGNITQKGQGTAIGGYWKVENPAGKPRCLFRGGNGASRTGYSKIDVSDNQWHVLRCVRTSSYVEMYIDGVRQSRLTGPTGNIANTAPLSIGGKGKCDGTNVTCDYFIGEIDYIRILKGS